MESAIEEPCPKTVLPRGAEPQSVGEHAVSYSDIDIIGHTNNVRYVVWAMDALPYELTSTKRVKDLYISFIKETTPGQKVELYRLAAEDGWFIEGRVEGKAVFCVKFVF